MNASCYEPFSDIYILIYIGLFPEGNFVHVGNEKIEKIRDFDRARLEALNDYKPKIIVIFEWWRNNVHVKNGTNQVETHLKDTLDNLLSLNVSSTNGKNKTVLKGKFSSESSLYMILHVFFRIVCRELACACGI